MEILGIGPLELLFILLIALIAVGPRDLGKAARSTGRLLNQLYKSEAWQNLGAASRSLRTLPNRLAREAALEELAQVKSEMEEGVTSGIDQLKSDIDRSMDTNPPPEAKEPREAELSPNNLDTGQAKDDVDQPSDINPVSDKLSDSPEPPIPEED
ncbi:MAG: hypothetical protein ACE5JF_03340 [Anaerolineales bacterium]